MNHLNDGLERVRSLNRLEALADCGCVFVLGSEYRKAREIGDLSLRNIINAISDNNLYVVRSSVPRRLGGHRAESVPA